MKIKQKMGNNQGITLIALIVTIIVLLILVGVSISILMGEEGLIRKSLKSKEVTQIGSEKEQIELSVSSLVSENKFEKLEIQNIQTSLNKTMGENVAIVYENGENFLVEINKVDRIYEIENKGKVKYLGYKTEVFGVMQNLEIGENILNVDNNEPNTYVDNSTGNLINYNGWDSSEYIDISNYNKIIIVSSATDFSTEWNALYDENKNFIKKINIGSAKIHNETIGDVKTSIAILKVEENQKYLRISQKSDILKQIRIYPVNDDFNGILHFYLDKNVLSNYNIENNIFESDSIVKGTYIHNSNGSQINYSTWDSTDYVYIGGYEKIVIGSQSSVEFGNYNAMYDKDKKYVCNPKISQMNTEYSNQIGKFKVINVPENVCYIRLSASSGVLENLSCKNERTNTIL